MWKTLAFSARSAPEWPAPMIPTVRPLSSPWVNRSQRRSRCEPIQRRAFRLSVIISIMACPARGTAPLPLLQARMAGLATSSGKGLRVGTRRPAGQPAQPDGAGEAAAIVPARANTETLLAVQIETAAAI